MVPVPTSDIRPGALMAVVPASLSSAEFASALLPHGLCFPPDPLNRDTTLVEMLARNAGGRRRLRDGTIASYLRGATLQVAGGKLEVGGQTVKNVTGYALAPLLAGKPELANAVDTLTLTLRPQPRARSALLLAFAETSHACAVATDVLRAGLSPGALAMLDQASHAMATQLLSADSVAQPSAGAVLLAEFDGHPQALHRHTTHLTAIAANYGGHVVCCTADAAELAACWRPWETLDTSLQTSRKGLLALDLTLPRAQLRAFVLRMYAIAAAYRLSLLLWGDIGVANLHPILVWDEHNEQRTAEVRQAALLLLQTAVAFGGSLAGERGGPPADLRLPNTNSHALNLNDAITATLL